MLEKEKSKIIKKNISAVEALNNLIKGKIFQEKISSFSNEFIQTGIPLGHAVNTIVPADTVMDMPNAEVVSYQNVPMVYLNGDPVPGGYANYQNYIKILEIFEGMLLVLVPLGNGQTPGEQWVIGYFETSVLGNSVEVKENSIVWNNDSNKTVVDSNGNFIYSLPATQTIQFLYETRNNKYACILFNGSNGELLTGYVPMSDGKFLRKACLRTGPLQPPTIAQESLPAGINMNLQTGLSTLTGSNSVINLFNNINSGEAVPTYFELSNGFGSTVLTSDGNLKSGAALNTLNNILNGSSAQNLAPAYYHHLYDPYNYPDALSCNEQGRIFGYSLINNHIPNTYYVLGLRVDEFSFNNVSSIQLSEIELCVTEFMNGLEEVIQGNFLVMLYTSLNMINNVSSPYMYTSSSLTKALLWMDSYLPNITDSTYEPTNDQIVNAFYEMNSVEWGGEVGWSVWGYENANNVTSCIANLDAISMPHMYYNSVVNSTPSGGSSQGTPTNLLKQGDIVEIKESAQYFAQGPLIGELSDNTFEVMESVTINTGATIQNGYVIKDCSNQQEYNIYSDQIEELN